MWFLLIALLDPRAEPLVQPFFSRAACEAAAPRQLELLAGQAVGIHTVDCVYAPLPRMRPHDGTLQ